MSQNRQLAAIMFTDIEGYTALMQQDEKRAISVRNRHRDVFENTTLQHKGKIIQYFGDGTLSVFKSTVEAVDCAIAIQQAFQKDPVIPVRIGIHVGDIVYTEEDIIGDAVNVASRIESCAVAGSILVSDKVHDQIRSHTHIKARFLDAYELKNVTSALPLFAIANKGLIVPDPKTIKGKLKDKSAVEVRRRPLKRSFIYGAVFLLLAVLGFFLMRTFSESPGHVPIDNSIAVIPFDNLSTDQGSEIFTDGITEDILTQLSKLKDLHVISRTSVMQYKKTKKTIPEIAKELGVTYILEGSMRKYGDQIRVTAQLIDTRTDNHIWAENYDRTLTDIFALQTEVSQEIADALKLNISFDEQQSLTIIPTENINAYQFFLRGRQEADKRNKESLAKSVQLYQQAIDLDPNYAEAYAEKANSVFLQTYYARANPEKAIKSANELLSKAEAINNRISRIYTVKGLMNNHLQKFDEAKKAFEKAIVLSPNDVTARHQYATFFFYTADYEKQWEQSKIAYELDPLSFASAISYFTALTYTKRFDEAEKLLENLESNGQEHDQFLMNRSYMRLYMAQKEFKKAIPAIKKLIPEEDAYTRFLGYCYAKIGDTLAAYRIIDTLKNKPNSFNKNHRVAVVFAGLQKTDSAFYYLDTVRNKSKLFNSHRLYYFDDLKDKAGYEILLNQHGIEEQ